MAALSDSMRNRRRWASAAWTAISTWSAALEICSTAAQSRTISLPESTRPASAACSACTANRSGVPASVTRTCPLCCDSAKCSPDAACGDGKAGLSSVSDVGINFHIGPQERTKSSRRNGGMPSKFRNRGRYVDSAAALRHAPKGAAHHPDPQGAAHHPDKEAGGFGQTRGHAGRRERISRARRSGL